MRSSMIVHRLLLVRCSLGYCSSCGLLLERKREIENDKWFQLVNVKSFFCELITVTVRLSATKSTGPRRRWR